MEDKNRLEQGFDDPERQVIYANGPLTKIGKCIDSIEQQTFESATEENLAEAEQKSEDSEIVPINNNVTAHTEEIAVARAENAGDVVANAKQKLENELRDAKDKNFANPIIKHLLERIEESESLATDICQEHKTWEKCNRYIYDQAKKQIKGSYGQVLDEVVYEWSEDYYHKDDKKEEEEKAKKEAERKKKEAEQKSKADSEKKNKNNPKASECKQEVKKDVKTKVDSKKKEDDGQMDMFSFLAELGGE